MGLLFGDPDKYQHDFEREKERRQQQSDMLKAIIAGGAQPEAINAVMQSLTQDVPQVPAGIKFGKQEKKKALYQKNTNTGLIERVPLGEDVSDFTVTDVTPPKPAKDVANDAQAEIAKKVVNDYFAAAEPDDNLRANAAKAARFLNMPIESLDVVKKHWGGLWNTKEKQDVPSFGSRTNSNLKSQFQTPEDVRKAYKAGKLGKDEAMDLLDQMGE